MASIRQIANRLGVSTSTVSLALRDDPRVRPETRERIQALATRYHYRPNRLTGQSRDEAAPPKRILVPARLVQRASCTHPKLPSTSA